MQASVIAEEKQAQFESDAAAFKGLRPGQQRTAAFLAKHTFACRQGLVTANAAVMGVADWLYDRLLTVPFNAVKPRVVKAWKAVTKPFRSNKPPDPDSRFNKLKRTLKEKISGGVKKAQEFLEFHGALGLYRATKWAFDPRTKSGKPFFGNETVNRVVGTTLGVCTFLVLSAWIGWLEVMSKVWHAQVAKAALGSTAPWLMKLTRQAVLHPALSVAAAAAQFLVIPSIAAARQAVKSTKIAQGIAYQYNTRLRDHRQKHKPKPATGWKPSAYVEKFFAEIIEKSSPEFYKARIRHFEARLRQKKLAKPAPPAAPPPPPTEEKPAAPALGPSFNGSAGEAPDPAKNAPPSSAPSTQRAYRRQFGY